MERPQSKVPRNIAAIAIQQWRRGLFRTGILMVLLGILAIVMPVFSSLAVNFLIGGVLTFGGLLAILFAFSLKGSGVFIWALISGLFPLCLGLYFLFLPAAALITLTALIAAMLLLTGISQGIFAFEMRGSNGWVWAVFSSLISIGLGIFIFVTLSEVSSILLGTVLGIDLMSTGLALIVISVAMPSSSESRE